MFKLFRSIVVAACLVIQILVIYLLYLATINKIGAIKIIYSIFCLYMILKIIKECKSYSLILPWIIIFIAIPIPGTIIYLTIKLNKRISKFYNSIIKEEKQSKKYLKQDEKTIKQYSDNSIVKYITNSAKYPVTLNNDVKYFSLGDYAFSTMIDEIKKAEKFIFFEYFIVNNGKMWSSILEVLEQKVQAGVEVRVMYDDFGCFTTLTKSYDEILRKKGIKCERFNKLKAFGGVVMNNRDHRKILVIDGKVAFSGGINIADEYINEIDKFGHWKDNCIMISGNAVWNYTVMFLTLWNAITHEDSDYNVYKYEFKTLKNKGIISPYGQNPLYNYSVAEDIYLNIINNSNKYVYIFTPYLIIDTTLLEALVLASKRGVDVRIIIPGIPDKKMVYMVSESYADALVKEGVKVYKYKPGFIHSKVCVSDDIRATVGTINMDYRSLYLHFECGCYFEDNDIIYDVKEDVLDTISKSELIENKKNNHLKSFIQSVLRLFSPLL